MKNKFNFIILVSLGIISCNLETKKIDQKSDSTKNVSNKDLKVETQIIEEQTETFDTLLVNENIHLTIIKTPLNSSVNNEYTVDNVHHIDKYKDYSITLKADRNSEIIIDTIFKKESFSSFTDQGFLSEAVFHNYWFKGIKNGQMEFFGVISKPETDWTFSFNHYLDLNTKRFKLIEEPDNNE
jgi:hypothetical protein